MGSYQWSYIINGSIKKGKGSKYYAIRVQYMIVIVISN